MKKILAVAVLAFTVASIGCTPASSAPPVKSTSAGSASMK